MSAPYPSVLRIEDPDAAVERRAIEALREEDREQAEREKLAFGLSPASAHELVGAER